MPKKFTRVAVDVMTAESGVIAVVNSVVNILKSVSHAHIDLVGDQTLIKSALERAHGAAWTTLSLSIHHSSDVVLHSDEPVSALKNKKNSSTHRTIDLVASGKADCAVSCANTGALAAISRYKLKRVTGTRKLALSATFPTHTDKVVHLCDAGASVDVTAEDLLNHARLASDMLSHKNGLERPRVALLNIGRERVKGSKLVQDAMLLFESEESINYVGMLEPCAIFEGSTDIVVSDGFTGNCVLKASEGAANFIFDMIQKVCKQSVLGILTGWYLKKILRRRATKLQPCERNGAIILGVNGVVVKSHGGASQRGIEAAIRLALVTAQSAYAEKVAKWRQSQQLSKSEVVCA